MNYYPPQPPPRQGMSGLTIALIVIVVLLVLGGGSCLVCVGLAAVAGDDTSHADAGSTSSQGALVHDKLAQDLEARLRQQGVPATVVLCPAEQPASFQCELTVGEDKAPIQVTKGATGLAFDVPGVAFLDSKKLATSFAGIVAKIDPRLTAPCLAAPQGKLMKKVGASFTCDVVNGTVPAGTLTVSVLDAAGNVKMDYAGTGAAPPRPQGQPSPPGQPPAPAVTPAPPSQARPRTVDFVCPPGKPPGGAVRAGCLCGSEILGTACGSPGNFVDVVATANGCRFTCN